VEIVELMAGQPVLMCVDLVGDRFLTGIPSRISREAPVLILEYESERFIPGGGANAVANISALGGRALPLGVVGADINGRALAARFRELGVTLEGVVEVAEYRTPTKTRILAGGRHAIKQQIVRYDVEDRLAAEDLPRSRWKQALQKWSEWDPRVAVLSDYGYGAVVPEIAGTIRDALGPSSVVLCDSRYRLAEFAGIDGATPNEEEAEGLAGQALGDDLSRVGSLGQGIRQRLGTSFLLITRGSRGASLILENGVAHIPVHGTDQVADVTGAGDTVIGTFALAQAAGATPLEAALVANYAGGIVVQKLGTATLSSAELTEALASDRRPVEEIRWDES
jgi:rfaE bifunctional protein kinase chain/domain